MNWTILVRKEGTTMKISLEAARVNAGYNKSRAAKLLGLSIPTLTKIEQGHRRIKPVELEGMAKMYNIDKKYLAVDAVR
jgi:DNA-binding XRE family transcriptional regulator